MQQVRICVRLALKSIHLPLKENDLIDYGYSHWYSVAAEGNQSIGVPLCQHHIAGIIYTCEFLSMFESLFSSEFCDFAFFT
jgi:hypothetical protein